jgi:hypothetical protein
VATFYYRALPRSPVSDGHDPVFHGIHLELFGDQMMRRPQTG